MGVLRELCQWRNETILTSSLNISSLPNGNHTVKLSLMAKLPYSQLAVWQKCIRQKFLWRKYRTSFHTFSTVLLHRTEEAACLDGLLLTAKFRTCSCPFPPFSCSIAEVSWLLSQTNSLSVP